MPIDSARAAVDPIVRLNAAVKTVRILGQILKNFPGSLDAETKLNILRACSVLGLRCLSAILHPLRGNEKAILREIMEIVRAHHPRLEDQELARRVSETLVGLARLASFGIIKGISFAVGSPELQTTYNRLLEETFTPATRLLHTSLALDHCDRSFPINEVKALSSELAKNSLALSVLRYLAVQHFYLFPVSYKTKQAVCDALGIAYGRIQGLDSRRKMIAG